MEHQQLEEDYLYEDEDALSELRNQYLLKPDIQQNEHQAFFKICILIFSM